MFHNDIQTNNSKRNTSEHHPIDQIFTRYLNMNNQIKTTSHTNIRTNNFKSETNYIIQRQRVIRSFLNKSDENEPSIRKPTTLDSTAKSLSITSISSPQLLYAELNESSSTNNNNRQQNIKKSFDHQSPILIRRQRQTIENLSSIQQMSDITNPQLSITIPSNFIFRNKLSRISLSDRSSSPKPKSLNYSKTISENNLKQNIYIPKIIHHTGISKLSQQNSIHNNNTRTLIHAKYNLIKPLKTYQRHQLQSERINTNNNLKTNYIQDLYISPQTLNNQQQEYDINKNISKKKFLLDEWEEDSKSNHDEDESISADGNSSTTTCISQISIPQSNHLSIQHESFSYPNSFSDNSKTKNSRLSLKRNISRRRAYNLALSPVTEYLDDEETGDEI